MLSDVCLRAEQAVVAEMLSHRHHVDSLCDQDSLLQSRPSNSCTELVSRFEMVLQMFRVCTWELSYLLSGVLDVKKLSKQTASKHLLLSCCSTVLTVESFFPILRKFLLFGFCSRLALSTSSLLHRMALRPMKVTSVNIRPWKRA